MQGSITNYVIIPTCFQRPHEHFGVICWEHQLDQTIIIITNLSLYRFSKQTKVNGQKLQQLRGT